jgi:hypothetical protein
MFFSWLYDANEPSLNAARASLCAARLSLHQVVALERSGPQGPRLAALDAALQLACAGPHSPLLRTDDGDDGGDDDDDGGAVEGGSSLGLASAAEAAFSSSPRGLVERLSRGNSGVGAGPCAEELALEARSSSVREQAVNLLVRYCWPAAELSALVEHRALQMLQRCADAVAAEAHRKQRGASLLQLRARDKADKAAAERAAAHAAVAAAAPALQAAAAVDDADEEDEPLDLHGGGNVEDEDEDEPLTSLEPPLTRGRVSRSNSLASAAYDLGLPGGSTLGSAGHAAAVPEPTGPSATARLFTFPTWTPAAAAAVRAQAAAASIAAGGSAESGPAPPPGPPPPKRAKPSSWGKAKAAGAAAAEGSAEADGNGDVEEGAAAAAAASAAAAAALHALAAQHRALDGAAARRLLGLPAALSGHAAAVLQKLVVVYAAAAPVAAATDAALAAARAADAQLEAQAEEERAALASAAPLAAEVGSVGGESGGG